jgi:hypothetical protein
MICELNVTSQDTRFIRTSLLDLVILSHVLWGACESLLARTISGPETRILLRNSLGGTAR